MVLEYKINDLANQATPTDSMQIETDIGGTTANKVTLANLATYLWNKLVAGVTSKFFPRVVTVSIPGNIAVANDISNWIIMPFAGTFLKAWLVAKTGPTGSDLIIDIRKSTNNGSSFATIYGTHASYKPTISAGQVAGNSANFDTTTFAAGDILRFDVGQVGSTIAGADLSLALAVLTQNI